MEHSDAALTAQSAAQLVQDQYLTLVRLARQLVDDLPTAEDVVQDVCVRLMSGDITQVKNPPAYLRTAVVNGARSALRERRTRRLREYVVDTPALVEDSVTSNSDGMPEQPSLLASIDLLPRRQREVIVLRYFEGMTITEIADELGISAHAVSASHFLAMKALRVIVNQGSGDRL